MTRCLSKTQMSVLPPVCLGATKDAYRGDARRPDMKLSLCLATEHGTTEAPALKSTRSSAAATSARGEHTDKAVDRAVTRGWGRCGHRRNDTQSLRVQIPVTVPGVLENQSVTTILLQGPIACRLHWLMLYESVYPFRHRGLASFSKETCHPLSL